MRPGGDLNSFNETWLNGGRGFFTESDPDPALPAENTFVFIINFVLTRQKRLLRFGSTIMTRTNHFVLYFKYACPVKTKIKRGKNVLQVKFKAYCTGRKSKIRELVFIYF